MTDMEILLNEIAHVEGCEATKARVISAIIRVAQTNRRHVIYLNPCKMEREAMRCDIAAMLRSGMRRNEAVSAAVERYRIARSTAYRIINEAINDRLRPHAAA